MKLFLYILKISALAYIALLGIMYALQRKLLYVPSKARPSLENFKDVYTEVQTQTRDKLTLTHWYAKRGAPYILVFHGNAGNIESIAYKFRFLADQGYSVLLVSWRGYGGNPGHPTEMDLISDSALALEWLIEEEKIDSKDTVLLGESLGSGTAIALAAEYPVKGLILDGSFSSITDVAQTVYPFIPVRLLLKDTWDSLSRIKKTQSPILFIHSKHDDVLPFRFAQKLFQAANKPKKSIWLDHPGHDDNLSSKFVRKALFDFLQSLRGGLAGDF